MPVLWTWLILLLAYLLGLPTPSILYTVLILFTALCALLHGYYDADPAEDDEAALQELAAVLTALAFTPILLAPFAAFTALIWFHAEYMDEGINQ